MSQKTKTHFQFRLDVWDAAGGTRPAKPSQITSRALMTRMQLELAATNQLGAESAVFPDRIARDPHAGERPALNPIALQNIKQLFVEISISFHEQIVDERVRSSQPQRYQQHHGNAERQR